MINFKIPTYLFVICLTISLILSACETGESEPVNNQPSQEETEEPNNQDENEPSNDVASVNKLLKEIIASAQKGMIKESSFNVMESTIETVKKEWGEPDQVDQAGHGYYASFPTQQVTIGYNEAGEVFDIRSYSKDLREITYELLEEELGKPTDVRGGNNERIYVFNLAQNIELKMIIPLKEKGVAHLSVFHSSRALAQAGEENEEYLLDIKGTSNQLSAKAWKSMQKWRKEIVTFSREQKNVYINGPNQKMVALTFDDGPDQSVTPAILDVLKQYQVKGSFFYLGSEVEKSPGVVKRTDAEGHLVLSHSYNHVDLTTLNQAALQLEIEKAGNAIKEVTGKEPAILRPPYGATTKKVVSTAEDAGYSIVLWSIDTLDWSQMESANIVNNVIANVRNGDIILMHSDSEKIETAKALPIMIEALKEQNFEIVDLETLLKIKAYQ
ncbi:polysaccharide deacetylase family protein [Sutcliffiella halmapala]|uniref:polysaccharide deacetylase family protein n=1 Tax=Sutcliffiella halmapala TaxID=79882 RepID=UPI000994C4D6|nr:polysaccharide deacetylase family protein [Sutcliffiella halmapala]